MASEFISMRFSGGEALARVYASLPEAVSRRWQLEALRKAAEPLRAEMAARAPRGPSRVGRRFPVHLKDSITIMTMRQSVADDPTVAVGPSKDAFWGFFQEYGTVRHGAQPFAGPSFDARVMTMLDTLRDEAWSAIRRRIPSVSAFGVAGAGGRFL